MIVSTMNVQFGLLLVGDFTVLTKLFLMWMFNSSLSDNGGTDNDEIAASASTVFFNFGLGDDE